MAQVKDELAAVGASVLDSKLVRIALKGFTKKWKFLSSVLLVGRRFRIGPGFGMILPKRYLRGSSG